MFFSFNEVCLVIRCIARKSVNPARVVDHLSKIARLTSNVNNTIDFITLVKAIKVEIAG